MFLDDHAGVAAVLDGLLRGKWTVALLRVASSRVARCIGTIGTTLHRRVVRVAPLRVASARRCVVARLRVATVCNRRAVSRRQTNVRSAVLDSHCYL